MELTHLDNSEITSPDMKQIADAVPAMALKSLYHPVWALRPSGSEVVTRDTPYFWQYVWDSPVLVLLNL